jgi:hypothetical protein
MHIPGFSCCSFFKVKSESQTTFKALLAFHMVNLEVVSAMVSDSHLEAFREAFFYCIAAINGR